VVATLLALAVVACSDDGAARGTSTEPTTSTTSTVVAAPLSVMLTDDDGVGAAGIDAMAVALRALPGVTLSVVAPADQRSGTGGKTTDGTLAARPAATASGIEATAIDGYPADTVIWAVDQSGLEQRPQLVVSGSNAGQNLGPVVAISGTIGAARAAAARGIPALAVSQGEGDPIDYSTSVGYAVDWIRQHRAELSAGTAPAAVTSINSPTCKVGSVKGIERVPVATDVHGRKVLASDLDCTVAKDDGVDDIDAFNAGYATISDVPVAA
jgi:5'-nucleotidase